MCFYCDSSHIRFWSWKLKLCSFFWLIIINSLRNWQKEKYVSAVNSWESDVHYQLIVFFTLDQSNMYRNNVFILWRRMSVNIQIFYRQFRKILLVFSFLYLRVVLFSDIRFYWNLNYHHIYIYQFNWYYIVQICVNWKFHQFFFFF